MAEKETLVDTYKRQLPYLLLLPLLENRGQYDPWSSFPFMLPQQYMYADMLHRQALLSKAYGKGRNLNPFLFSPWYNPYAHLMLNPYYGLPYYMNKDQMAQLKRSPAYDLGKKAKITT